MWPHLNSVSNTSPAAHCHLSVSNHPGPTFTDDGKESVLSHAPFSHGLVRLHGFTSALSGVSELFVSDSRQGATRDSRQKLSRLEEPLEELRKSWRICKTSMIAAFLLLVVQYFILHWTEVWAWARPDSTTVNVNDVLKETVEISAQSLYWTVVL